MKQTDQDKLDVIREMQALWNYATAGLQRPLPKEGNRWRISFSPNKVAHGSDRTMAETTALLAVEELVCSLESNGFKTVAFVQQMLETSIAFGFDFSKNPQPDLRVSLLFLWAECGPNNRLAAQIAFTTDDFTTTYPQHWLTDV